MRKPEMFSQQAKVKYVIIRKDGKKKEVYGSGGYVANYVNLIKALMWRIPASLRLVTGVTQTFDPSTMWLRQISFRADEGNPFGISVGQNATQYTFDDFTISLILHGTGQGMLYYRPVTFGEEVATAYRALKFSREIENLSGAKVTVYESGLVGNIVTQTWDGWMLLARDVPGTGLVLDHGDKLIITWHVMFRLTV